MGDVKPTEQMKKVSLPDKKNLIVINCVRNAYMNNDNSGWLCSYLKRGVGV